MSNPSNPNPSDPEKLRPSESPDESDASASTEEEEEFAPVDDTIIGRAFAWSLVVFVFLALLIGGLVYALNRRPAPPPNKVTRITPPQPIPSRAAEIPKVRFTDITRSAGITFVHNNGAYGDKLLPETLGGGVAFFDYDNDGAPDLLFVNSTYWPGHIPKGKKPTTMALYHNDGHGHFTDVTAGSGLDVSFYGMGVAIGDYDNDGRDDVFLTGVGGNHLFHNEGDGHFKDVTKEAGVGGPTNGWSTSCAWIDYNNDGRLDLFVCNYVKWSKAIDFQVDYRLVGIGRAYGPPMNFPGSYPTLYRNDGHGHFTDVSATCGIQIRNPETGQPMAKSLGVCPVDINGDGWMDLIVANDTVQNFVFLNQKNGTFKEVGAQLGIAFDNYGNARGAMGIDAAHFRNNQSLGIAIGNFANEMTALYVSQNTPTNFSDEAIADGIGGPSRLPLKFGLFFFDYDLDGWLDLLTANGHIEDEIHQVQPSESYAQPAQLFWNSRGVNPHGGFLSVPESKTGPDLFRPIVGRGSAFADIDGDGDLDVVLTQIAGPPLLLRNDQHLGHHWIRFKLIGTTCNRDAIGAIVKIWVGSHLQQRQVMPTRSYLSQSELPVTFGLGSATHIDRAQIVWPGRQIQKIGPVNIDALNIIHQPTNPPPALQPQKAG